MVRSLRSPPPPWGSQGGGGAAHAAWRSAPAPRSCGPFLGFLTWLSPGALSSGETCVGPWLQPVQLARGLAKLHPHPLLTTAADDRMGSAQVLDPPKGHWGSGRGLSVDCLFLPLPVLHRSFHRLNPPVIHFCAGHRGPVGSAFGGRGFPGHRWSLERGRGQLGAQALGRVVSTRASRGILQGMKVI